MVAILVVLFIVISLTVNFFVERSAARNAPPVAALPPARREIPLPRGLFLDGGHTWAALEPSGRVRLGLDDLARSALGRADSVEIPRPGTEIRRGQPLFTVVQGQRRATFSSPIDGVLASVNGLLAAHPETLARDPYQKGWVLALLPKNLGASLRNLFVADEAARWLAGERERFEAFVSGRLRLAPQLGAVMPDGGRPVDGVLQHLDDDSWNAFTRDFLSRHDTPVAE
jgi:glycine cleavage system H protein